MYEKCLPSMQAQHFHRPKYPFGHHTNQSRKKTHDQWKMRIQRALVYEPEPFYHISFVEVLFVEYPSYIDSSFMFTLSSSNLLNNNY